MAYTNRQKFGLNLISFILKSDGSFITALADATSIALTPNRTAVDNVTSSGLRQGEHTADRMTEVTVSGVMSLPPDACRIIEGSALIAGTDSAIAGDPAPRILQATQGDWTGVTITASSSAISGIYHVVPSSATAASVRVLNRLKDQSDESELLTNHGLTFSGLPTTTDASALVIVEPAVTSRSTYVGGRPGVNPPVVSIVAQTDPVSYMNADERNVKGIYIPRCTLQGGPITFTSKEISSSDMTFKGFYDDDINGEYITYDLQGIAE